MTHSELVAFVQKKITSFAITEDDIELALQEVEQTILSYCCISAIPDALYFVWGRMTIDLIQFEHESATKPEDVLDAFDPSDVSTIKVGDTTISLGDKYRSNQRSRILQSHQSNLDTIVMNFKEHLNRYRRIW